MVTKNTSINKEDRFINQEMKMSVAILDTNECDESCLVEATVTPAYKTTKFIATKEQLLNFMIKNEYKRLV